MPTCKDYVNPLECTVCDETKGFVYLNRNQNVWVPRRVLSIGKLFLQTTRNICNLHQHREGDRGVGNWNHLLTRLFPLWIRMLLMSISHEQCADLFRVPWKLEKTGSQIIIALKNFRMRAMSYRTLSSRILRKCNSSFRMSNLCSASIVAYLPIDPLISYGF